MKNPVFEFLEKTLAIRINSLFFFLVSESPPPPYCLFADRLRPEGECLLLSYFNRGHACAFADTFHVCPYTCWNRYSDVINYSI